MSPASLDEGLMSDAGRRGRLSAPGSFHEGDFEARHSEELAEDVQCQPRRGVSIPISASDRESRVYREGEAPAEPMFETANAFGL